MNKKHLSKSSDLLIFTFMTLLHCTGVIGVYLLAEGGFSIGTIGFSYNVPELLCFVPFLIPVVADILLRKLTDIKPYITLVSSLFAVILCFAFYLINPNGKEDSYMFFGENYIFFLLALISLAVRCVFQCNR